MMNRTIRSVVLGWALMAALGHTQSRAEVATDVLTGSNMVRQTASAGTNYFMANLGIGTNSPKSRLHVLGNADIVGGLSVSGAVKVVRQGDVGMGVFTNGVSAGGMSGALPAGTTGYLMYYNGTQWTAMTNMYMDSANQRVYFSGGGAGTYVSAASGAMTMGGNIALNGKWLSGDGGNEGISVDSSGRVGVGISSPVSAMHVHSNMNLAAITVEASAPGNNWTSSQLILRSDGSNRAAVVGQEYNGLKTGVLIFQTADSNGTLREHVRLDESAQLQVDMNNTTTDSQGVRFNVGNGTTARASYTYLDVATGYFRVVGSTNGSAETVLAKIRTTSGWEAGCSESLKIEVREVEPSRALGIRQDFEALKVFTYRRKDDPGREEIGVISETTSPWIQGSGDDTVSPLRWLGYLTAVVKDQQAQIDALRREINALKGEKP